VNGEIEIGDFCTVVGATFATDNRVKIGDYTFISYEVFIADHPFPVPPDLDHISGFASKPLTIHIGRNVWIGARATICGEVRIGDDSIVGAGAVVFEDVPPQTIVAGNPARVVRRLRPK
jgi:acetyltransferase-like isoleucine patch superfamily enzyme